MDCTSGLTLTNDYDQLTRLEAWLQGFAEENRLAARARFSLDLVLTEAVTNVLDHSLPPGKPGRIELHCALQEDCITVHVIDDGPPFDPTAAAPARLPKTLAEARPGGLGIHLMRQYTSRMDYRREQGQNVLCMTLPLQRAAPSP